MLGRGAQKTFKTVTFLHVLAPGGVAAPIILPTENSPCPPASRFIVYISFAGLTKTQDDARLLGINNMNIICNIRSNLGGLFKTSNPYNYAALLDFTVLLTFLNQNY